MNPASNDVSPTGPRLHPATPEGRAAGARPLSPDAVQRAVILELLDVPDQGGLPPAQLRQKLHDIPAEQISTAVLALKRAALVEMADGVLLASTPARHLDRLDLVAV